jgi:dienelactone hydrolase
VISENINYAADGRSFAGRLFHDENRSGLRPGVLVCHEGAGPSEHIWEQSQLLAELGYVAYAPDLFGETFTSREAGVAVISGLVADPQRLRARTCAALDVLRNHPHVDASRTAAIGYCFGGLAVLELARSGSDVACVASFHGSLSSTAPAQPGQVRSQILVCIGASDPFIGSEQRSAFELEMTRAGADWQIITYSDAQHGFTNRHVDPTKHPGSAYHARTAQRSWRAMLDMFDDVFEAA